MGSRIPFLDPFSYFLFLFSTKSFYGQIVCSFVCLSISKIWESEREWQAGLFVDEFDVWGVNSALIDASNTYFHAKRQITRNLLRKSSKKAQKARKGSKSSKKLLNFKSLMFDRCLTFWRVNYQKFWCQQTTLVKRLKKVIHHVIYQPLHKINEPPSNAN